MGDEIIEAIKNHNYLDFQYEGHPRTVIPYAYGDHVTTRNKVLRALQVGGSSSSNKFDVPKLFNINQISGLSISSETFNDIPEGYKKGDEHINPIEGEL